MNKLANYAKRHALAFGIFLVYVVGWVKLSGFAISSPLNAQRDACAAGMLMLPVLAGIVASFVYCFTILLFAIFNQQSARFFWLLLLLAVTVPSLLLNFA